MKSQTVAGMILATAAAALAVTGCATCGPDAQVKCGGVNQCKGRTACKTSNNGCQGQNSCKGTGWVPMSEAECAKAGGNPV